MGVYLDQASHGVTSVESALWTTQHIDALYIVEVEVKSRFVEIRNIVNIQSHCWSVDARANAANVDGRRKPGAIVRNVEVCNHVAHAF